MHLARFPGLDDESGLHAQTLADQVVMDRGSSERGWDRRAILARRAVGDHQHVDIGKNGLGRFPAEPGERRFQRLAASACPGRVERLRAIRTVERAR